MAHFHVIIVETEPVIVRALERVLRQESCEIVFAETYQDALSRLSENKVDLVFLSLDSFPEDERSSILQTFQAHQVLLILLAGYTSFYQGSQTKGCFDVLLTPFESLAQVRLTLERARQQKKLLDRVRELESQSFQVPLSYDLIGQSAQIRTIRKLCQTVSSSRSPVLLLGEAGTEKEQIARLIHGYSRKKAPFFSLHCASLPENFLEIELFGTVEGAFPGAKDTPGLIESAHTGTLFLDEIETLSPSLQAKLLAFLQKGEQKRLGATQSRILDVRLIAASQVELLEWQESGRFRQDLYYQISVFPLSLTPLRERREDISLLAKHFIKKHHKNNGRIIRGFTSEALLRLQNHLWLGNVRELENTIERAIVISHEELLSERDLEFAWKMAGESVAPPTSKEVENLLDASQLKLPYADAKQQVVEAFDRSYTTMLLKKTGGNVSEASRQAGLDRSNFRRLLRRYGIDPAHFHPIESTQ